MRDLSALHDIALFVEVARTANFSRASENLGISTATLSRRIAAMEQRFDTRLFHRTTRRVDLTDAGRRYFERCEHLADEALLAQDVLRDASQRPTGHLRVTMPVDLGMHNVGPLLPEFARLHPGITFEFDLSPVHRDLIGEHFDIAIRLGTVKSEQLVSRRIGWIDLGLFASPAYLALRGHALQPTDLVEHDCIFVGAGQKEARWRLTRDEEALTVTVQGRFAVNSQSLMSSLCERGMGIAALAPALWRDALATGRLMPVLPDWSVPRLGVYVVTASRMQPASVRAFVQFLANRFAPG